MPSLAHFSDWYCHTLDPAAPLDCALPAGFESAYSLSAAFSISDQPDAIQQHGRVAIETNADRPLDLTALSAVTFDVRLTSATTMFPPGAFMYLELLCSTAVDESGASLVGAALVQSIAFTDTWSPVDLAISNFGPAPWTAEHIQGGGPACLRAVDGFQFNFDPAILDGQTGEGVFSIDNVRLQ